MPGFDLRELGWTSELADNLEPGLVPGRVAAAHRGAFDVWTERDAVRSRLPGRLMHDGLEVAVGDWVGLSDGLMPISLAEGWDAADFDRLQRPLGLDAECDRVLGPPRRVGRRRADEAGPRRPRDHLVNDADDRRRTLALVADGPHRHGVQVALAVVDEYFGQFHVPHRAAALFRRG